ncbi:hypothetical protein, partial [Streptomyces sp. NPDC047981]|uniref:hypothetical protein n=1 Tax=Streptomyces sp. NPDC047981 TaxID=3154610 RepID=UPI00341259B9
MNEEVLRSAVRQAAVQQNLAGESDEDCAGALLAAGFVGVERFWPFLAAVVPVAGPATAQGWDPHLACLQAIGAGDWDGACSWAAQGPGGTAAATPAVLTTALQRLAARYGIDTTTATTSGVALYFAEHAATDVQIIEVWKNTLTALAHTPPPAAMAPGPRQQTAPAPQGRTQDQTARNGNGGGEVLDWVALAQQRKWDQALEVSGLGDMNLLTARLVQLSMAAGTKPTLDPTVMAGTVARHVMTGTLDPGRVNWLMSGANDLTDSVYLGSQGWFDLAAALLKPVRAMTADETALTMKQAAQTILTQLLLPTTTQQTPQQCCTQLWPYMHDNTVTGMWAQTLTHTAQTRQPATQNTNTDQTQLPPAGNGGPAAVHLTPGDVELLGLIYTGSRHIASITAT